MSQGIRESRVAQILVVVIVGSIVQVIAGGLVGEIVAGGHAQLHAGTALVVAVVGLAIRLRWVSSGAASGLPAFGLGVLAAAWLIESLGAYGFGPDNDSRVNAFVLLHDLGLDLVGLGMLAAVIGVVTGVAVAARRRTGVVRWLVAGGAVVGLAGGLVFLLAMFGMLPDLG